MGTIFPSVLMDRLMDVYVLLGLGTAAVLRYSVADLSTWVMVTMVGGVLVAMPFVFRRLF